jgi:acyl-CoA thioester hydrolase
MMADYACGQSALRIRPLIGYAGSRTRKAGKPMSREQFWFFHPFRVRYSEIDGQGVVFNAHYLTYFDTTISEYFRALGYDQYADAKQSGVDFHVVKSVIEYKAPVRFDWELDVGARVARIGNSSMTFELAIFLKDESDALVTGEIVWVNTDQNTHRPVPISKEIRDLIATCEKHLAA